MYLVLFYSRKQSLLFCTIAVADVLNILIEKWFKQLLLLGEQQLSLLHLCVCVCARASVCVCVLIRRWFPWEILRTREIGGGMFITTWAIVIGPMQTIMTWGHIHLSWPSSPTSLLASCWLKHVSATASPPPTKQPTTLPVAPCPWKWSRNM